ncbi:glycosyl hydrolase family 61-domain-containing protein [Tuber indicum]|nr:glycosyl hydrolase family 61-domain-containing protein [Tuber indicum]
MADNSAVVGTTSLIPPTRDPLFSQGAGNVWTKIAESGLSGGKWAVETLIANGGKHDVTLPTALAAGDYLLRAEIIALHEADTDYTVNPARGAQFYPSCSQLKVTGSGTVTPPGTFGFLGGYSHNDPGILFNLYNGATSYTIPGPAVWDGKTGGSAPAPSSTAVVPSTTRSVTTALAATTAPAATSVSAPGRTSSAIVPAASSPTKPAGDISSIVAKYYQCGGKIHTGGTNCATGTKCTFQNEYYSQCL